MSQNNPQPELPIPPDNGNGDHDPPFRPPRITSVSPIGGLLAGGFDVTIRGMGFQPDAEVFFGAAASPEVTFVSSSQVLAKVPAATQVGSVDVRLVNPDGTTANRPGAFTYVTNEGSLHAEVLGVTPLAVIEATDSETTIRGRNLIAAYNDGIVALRGPSRVQVAFSNFGSNPAQDTGIEELVLTVRVTATPALEQHERIAIQVLASLSPDAANTGIFTSSRQMFTVLPRAVPVALAFTANIDPGRANLVMVAGRNLAGASLDLGGGATIHTQQSNDHTIAAIVSFPEGAPTPGSLSLRLLDDKGSDAAQFDVTIAQSIDVAKSGGTATALAEPGEGDFGLTLTPVPGQQLTGPTKEDSAVFSLRGESLFPSFGFDAFFFYDEFDIDIPIPLFNEVRLIPFFDNGVGDFVENTPVLAEVGKLFRLRGVGVLVALRVDLIIRIHVVIIIGIIFFPWDFGFFNEFPNEFPFGIGSIVVIIRVRVLIFLSIAFMVALVEPGGHLRMLFFFNLELGVDFFFSADNHVLQFDARFHHKVNYTKVSPFHNLLPCDGRFQLLEENGRTVFTDNFGATVAFYFPRTAGQCCLSWDFDLRLVQFEEGGPEEIVQDSFRTEFCINAAAPTNVVNIIITSEHPAPTGVEPQRHLEMTFNDRALLKVLAEPADANGNPTGPPQDITTLGYTVEFYLDPFFPDLFNPVFLPSGDALPVQAGNNFIHARIHGQGDAELFNFRPDDVLGFVIQSFISQGLLPAVLAGVLPVTVADPTEIVVTPTLVFREGVKLFESPSLFANQGEVVREIERYEPWEYDSSPIPKPQQREYTLAARISFPTNAHFPQKVKFTIKEPPQMVVLIGTNTTPVSEPPLEGTRLQGTRTTDKEVTHFFAKVVQKDQAVEIDFQQRPAVNEQLIELKDSNREFTIAPNIRDEGQNHLVPPGKLVANRQVMLLIDLKAESDQPGAPVASIKQLKLVVRNDETYEEYLRVLPEVRTILSGPFASFPRNFYNALPEGAPSADQLAEKGKQLWDLAVADVQNSTDDRPLYWARLQTICALRAFYKRNRLGEPPVTQFEWPSRGLELNGTVSFGTATTGRRAIVTGYDPFGLPSAINQCNPSGLVALWFSGKSLTSSQGPTTIRTAIFPVRYKDFDEGLLEQAVTSGVLNQIVLLMTCSQGGNTYDVDRFAGRNRGHVIPDNSNQFNTGTPVPNSIVTVPPGLATGDEFIESTLPYERVITSNIATRRLPGPQSGSPPFPNDTAFMLNQHYWVVGVSATEVLFKYRAQPTTSNNNDPNFDATYAKKEKPDPQAKAQEGSGQNFLSNEIFYRTALQRTTHRPTLPSGHFHLPKLGPSGTDPATGPGLVDAVKTALTSFLSDQVRLRSSGDVTFPPTVITQTSAEMVLTAMNETSAAINIPTVQLDPPQPFTLVTPLPASAAPNAPFQLRFKFSPQTVGTFYTVVRVRDGSGEILFSAQLNGDGIPVPPAPVISSFSPTMGVLGDLVTILGTNFTGATAVKVGPSPLLISAVAPTAIDAEVAGPPRTGLISVTTPGGTGTSTQTFRVHAPPHHPPDDLAAQLTTRRAELGLSPQQAATQMGTRSGTYRRWERGLDRPSPRFHEAIVSFLGRDPDPDPQEFGQRIRTARERDGLSRSQLARQLGVSSSTVKAWEAGTVSRPSQRVERIFEDYINEA